MELELCIWPSDFGLPSIDCECLQFMACAKFCAAPVSFTLSRAPWKSKTGAYPVVIVDGDANSYDHEAHTFQGFCDFLRRGAQDVILDGDLTLAEKCEFDAYASLMRHSFYPAQLHTIWLDQFNYSAITYRWFFTCLSFPYSIFYVEKQKRRAQAYFDSIGISEEQSMRNAIDTVNVISAKLGDKKYFYGDKPSSLDALIFGYLAPVLKFPLPSDALKQHIFSCPNLVRFVDSIISIYLPLTETQCNQQAAMKDVWQYRCYNARVEAEKTIHRRSNSEKKAKMNETLLFCISAASLSLFFALHVGLISVHNSDVELDEDT